RNQHAAAKSHRSPQGLYAPLAEAHLLLGRVGRCLLPRNTYTITDNADASQEVSDTLHCYFCSSPVEKCGPRSGEGAPQRVTSTSSSSRFPESVQVIPVPSHCMDRP